MKKYYTVKKNFELVLAIMSFVLVVTYALSAICGFITADSSTASNIINAICSVVWLGCGFIWVKTYKFTKKTLQEWQDD